MIIGIIYKITGACGNVYIGSTTKYRQRKSAHLTHSNGTSSKLLKKPLVFEIIKQEEYIDRNYMRSIEQFYMDNAINCINNNRATGRKEREECIYCKKLLYKKSMNQHYQSNGCRLARGEIQ